MEKILLLQLKLDGKITPIYFDPRYLFQNDVAELYVQSLKSHSAKYHPAKITYTGVTVGGVHTGGFSTQKAYYSTSSAKTDFGDLKFKPADSYTVSSVWEVIIPPDLQKIAQKEVGRFLSNGNTIVLYTRPNSGYFHSVVNAISSGDVSRQASLFNDDLSNHAMMDKCKQVADFVNRVMLGEFLTSEQRCDAAKTLLEVQSSLAWNAAANLLRNTTTDQEKELLATARKKTGEVKLYPFKGYVYADKKNFSKAVFGHIVGKAGLPVVIVAIILFFLACTPGKDTSGYFLWALILFFGWLVLFVVAGVLSPDKDSYSKGN